MILTCAPTLTKRGKLFHSIQPAGDNFCISISIEFYLAPRLSLPLHILPVRAFLFAHLCQSDSPSLPPEFWPGTCELLLPLLPHASRSRTHASRGRRCLSGRERSVRAASEYLMSGREGPDMTAKRLRMDETTRLRVKMVISE